MCQTFGIRELNAYQREVIVQFAQKKTDVFLNLSTVWKVTYLSSSIICLQFNS